MKTQYDDIISLPHPTSATHPRMSRHNRAAQFAPFAALTGYEAAIQETGRTTDREVELDEDALTILDNQLQELELLLPHHPQVTVTYFQPDSKKSGGAYLHISDRISSIDRSRQQLVTVSGDRIPMGRIKHLDFSCRLHEHAECFEY